MVFDGAEYTFEELFVWKIASFKNLLGRHGVVSLDVSERHNRLAIGVSDRSDEALIRAVLDSLGVPDEAVALEVVQLRALPVADDEPGEGLKSRYRPMVGGLKITVEDQAPCSLGFGAYDPGTGMSGFVTAAHCTASQGWEDGDYVYQPTVQRGPNGLDTFAGYEDWDGSFEQTSIEYEPGYPGFPPIVYYCDDVEWNLRECRWSDAAFISAWNVRRGYVAATASGPSYNGPSSASRNCMRQ